jgi:hypothetical protein
MQIDAVFPQELVKLYTPPAPSGDNTYLPGAAASVQSADSAPPLRFIITVSPERHVTGHEASSVMFVNP